MKIMKTNSGNARLAQHKKSKMLLPALIASLLGTSVMAQEVIWSEDFNASENAGKGVTGEQHDVTNVTKWSVNVANAGIQDAEDWFRVNNQMFEGRDLNGEAILRTESIDISGTDNVNFSLVVSQKGAFESSDYVDVAYSLDGGPFNRVSNWQKKGSSQHTLVDDFGTVEVAHAAANASSLVIQVSMKNNAAAEYLRVDDIRVYSGATVSSNANVNASNGTGAAATSSFGRCGAIAVPISKIQGTGDKSPLAGQDAIVEATVTNIAPAVSGFFVQSSSNEEDGDSKSSEGLYVYLNGQTQMPAIGQRVRLVGGVSERYDRTQLSLSDAYIDCGEGERIAPTTLTLPYENVSDLEALEGMLVVLPQTLSVTDTYGLTRYGQFAVSNGRLIKSTNMYRADNPKAAALAERNKRNKLVVDDLSSTQNPETLPYPSPSLRYDRTMRLGDTVSGLEGTIEYGYGNYQLYPTKAPVFTQANPRNKAVIEKEKGEIKVASFNVLNFFNGDGDGVNGFPTPRGADTVEEFKRQKTKIVSAIAHIDADIVGLMEIENDGYGAKSAIAELVAALNQVAGKNTYAYVTPNVPKLGSDAIAVGMIYKPLAVRVVGEGVTTATTPFDYGNRQPLVQSFEQVGTGEQFTFAVNHFKSKGSCKRATGLNKAQGDGQGCWNALRTKAAKSLVSWLASNPTGVADSDILIVGDLNAYGKEDPVNAIMSAGYHNLMSERVGDSSYSYSYAGEMGYLDHALASKSLNGQVSKAMVWHVNADEPRAFDYNTENKSAQQVDAFYGPGPYRASDHDPVVITLKLGK